MSDESQSFESQPLAGYAMSSAGSRGRVHEEPTPDEVATSCFQRDRERIVRSRAFRRLLEPAVHEALTCAGHELVHSASISPGNWPYRPVRHGWHAVLAASDCQ